MRTTPEWGATTARATRTFFTWGALDEAAPLTPPFRVEAMDERDAVTTFNAERLRRGYKPCKRVYVAQASAVRGYKQSLEWVPIQVS